MPCDFRRCLSRHLREAVESGYVGDSVQADRWLVIRVPTGKMVGVRARSLAGLAGEACDPIHRMRLGRQQAGPCRIQVCRAQRCLAGFEVSVQPRTRTTPRGVSQGPVQGARPTTPRQTAARPLLLLLPVAPMSRFRPIKGPQTNRASMSIGSGAAGVTEKEGAAIRHRRHEFAAPASIPNMMTN